MIKVNSFFSISAILVLASMISCKKEDVVASGKDINTASKVTVDRFSSNVGKLMVRSASNGLPAANAAINFDLAPFLTTGLDKSGSPISYYNFDVQSTTPDDIYVMFKAGSSTPVAGQHNIIPTIPGDAGYNDFWVVNKVTVPDNYVVNTLTSEAEVLASGYAITKTTSIVNCPVVPFGSTAKKSKTAGVASALTLGWYKGQAVAYFSFEEAAVSSVGGLVPLSPIYVMFNDNTAGPSSGFKAEATNAAQTHNVLATSPGDVGYSPLWSVQVIDNAKFSMVTNLTTAIAATSSPAGATVNCPVIK
jgi:hypothetical protein